MVIAIISKDCHIKVYLLSAISIPFLYLRFHDSDVHFFLTFQESTTILSELMKLNKSSVYASIYKYLMDFIIRSYHGS